MSKLLVYSASAGSGKTHSIVGRYLSLLFSNEKAYQHVLAVTFTNKAGEEMKSRIIHELDKLASGDESGYYKDLINETGLSKSDITKKSKQIFKQILHDYSHFSVSTIDSFFQKILKNFAYETGIQYNYEIELDSEKVINIVIDNLIIKSKENKDLKYNLIQLINQNIKEGNKWDTRTSLKSFIKEIYHSEYRRFENDYNIFFGNEQIKKQFLKELQVIISNYKSEINVFLESFTNTLKNNGVWTDDFSGASKSYPKKLLDIEVKLDKDGVDKVFDKYQDHSKWLKKSDLNDSNKVSVTDKLIDICNKHFPIISDKFSKYKLAENISKQFFFISIINYAFKEIHQYKLENNKFMISEVPEFLSEISRNNSTSFIYEKIGTYYSNYLIDEFQDTSQIQWDAFYPLILESLSNNENNENILVGDVKQSIYAWRGGDWELLAEKVKNQLGLFYHEVDLDDNYRSGKNIVNFNNDFFELSAEVLENDFVSNLPENLISKYDKKLTSSIYNKTRQHCKSHKEGYIELNIIENSLNVPENRQIAMQIMISQIEEIQKKGYNPGDIMILVRANVEGKEIASFILDYSQSNQAQKDINYDVVSAESLFLISNDSICFIITCLSYFLNNEDKLAFTEAAYIYYRLKYISSKNNINFILDDYYQEFESKTKTLQTDILNYSLPEIIDRLILHFELSENKDNIPFLTSFRDIVHNYTLNQNSQLYNFLEWWEEYGSKQTIIIPEQQNAINIITVHKAKGLAAEFVLVPFCNWDLVKLTGMIWCKIDIEPYNILPAWPLKFNSKLINGITDSTYYHESFKRTVESYNMMYVAFTRAKQGLYITSLNKTTKNSNSDKIKDTGNLLYHSVYSNSKLSSLGFIEDSALFDDTKKFTKGIIPESSETKESTNYFEEYPVFIPSKEPVIKSFFDETINPNESENMIRKGIIYHKIFEKINYNKDVEQSIKTILNNGLIKKSEAPKIIDEVKYIISNNKIKQWFDGTYNVKNEVEIFCGNGIIKRPDRIMIQKNHAIVLDYKFGENQEKSHLNQITQYGSLLKKMGFSKVEMYVWYVFQNLLLKVENDKKTSEIKLDDNTLF